MKRKVALLMALLALGSAVAATDWVELGKDGKNQTWSIDRDSVHSKSYSIVSVWAKIEYPKIEIQREEEVLPNGALSALPTGTFSLPDTLLLLEFDFSDRTYRQLAEHRGSVRDTTPSGWDYIVPNTIAENIYSTLKGWLNR